MMRNELEERTGHLEDWQWTMAHEVYQNHPTIKDVGGKDQIADIVKLGFGWNSQIQLAENKERGKMDGIVTIEEIKSHSKGHWFDAGATRFFRSRYPQTGIRKGDKAYFITSEQFVGSNHIPAPRRYTIRVLDYTTGDISTVADFNRMTRSQANTALKHIIRGR